MRATQTLGLMLWRGGLLLAGGAALWEGLSLALRFVDLPVQVEVGLGLLVAGALFVASSLIAERVTDARTEGDLS